MAKYVFVTGGVVSSLGKGITAASIGCLLQSYGLRVNMPRSEYVVQDQFEGLAIGFRPCDLKTSHRPTQTFLCLGFGATDGGQQLNCRLEDTLVFGTVNTGEVIRSAAIRVGSTSRSKTTNSFSRHCTRVNSRETAAAAD